MYRVATSDSTTPPAETGKPQPLSQLDLAALAPNQIQLVTTANTNRRGGFSKSYRLRDGRLYKQHSKYPYAVTPSVASAHDLRSAIEVLQFAEANSDDICMILGALNIQDKRVAEQLKTQGYVTRTKKEMMKNGKLQLPCFIEVERHLYAIDFDPTPAQLAWCRSQGLDVYEAADAAVRACVNQFLPEALQYCAYGYQLSAGAGLSKDETADCYGRDAAHVKFHVFIWLKAPRMPRDVKAWVEASNQKNISRDFGELNKSNQWKGGLDRALYQAVQPHFIRTRFRGCDDPLAGQRWGLIDGGELDIEEQTRVDEWLEGTKSVRQDLKVLRIRAGEHMSQVPIALNGKSLTNMPWPYDWRGRFELMAPGLINEVVRAATWALARDLETEHGIEQAKREEVKRPFLDEIYRKVLSTPGQRTDYDLEKHRADIDRLYEGALPQVEQQRIAREREQDIVIPPLYQESRLPFNEAEAQLTAAIAEWFVHADFTVKAKSNNRAMVAKGLGWNDEGYVHFYPDMHRVIAAETGLGKTQCVITAFLALECYNEVRLYISVPTHEKAEELRKDYLATAIKMGIKKPPVTVFEGLERACNADDTRKKTVLACAKSGHSPKKGACRDCPLRNECSWLTQTDDNGPGLKIIVSAYLGLELPGLARRDEDEGAPVLGFVIDERYEQNLMHEAVLLQADIPKAAFWTDGAFGLPRDERELLDDGMKLLRRELGKCGPLSLDAFSPLMLHVEYDGEWLLKISVLCSRLKKVIFALKVKLDDEIQRALAEGVQPDIEEPLKAIKIVTNVKDAFELIRTSDFAKKNDQTEVRGCRVLRVGKGGSGGQALRLHYMKRLPEVMSEATVLVLDATASRMRCALPFALRDDYHSRDVLQAVEFFPIRARPECKEAVCLVKIRNAPVARHHFESSAYEDADDGTPREARTLKKMRADALFSPVLNVVEAIAGRAIVDGSSAGLISYKGVAAYIEQHRPLPDLITGHFGAVAGLNNWKDVDILFVVGRNMLALDALIDTTEAIFALDPEGRQPDRNAEILRPVKGLSVAGEINGVPCRVEEPTCPLVRDVYIEYVVGKNIQAIGRGRALRRDPSRRLLIIDISNTVPDLTYEAVIDWHDIEGTSELAAVLHANGVLLEKPADLKAVAPQHFTGRSEARHTADDLWKRTNSSKRSLAPNKDNNIIGAELRFAHFVRLAVQTVIAGNIDGQELLAPAAPEPATYGKHKSCLIDTQRRERAEATLQAALNSSMRSGPARRAAHRPRHNNPSPDALRMRRKREKERQAAATEKKRQ